MVAISIEADDVVSLELAAPDGSPLPAWSAGAHLDVGLPSGLVRQYSLCGDLADRHSYTIGVLRDREGRGGSEEIHTVIRVGHELNVSAPRNHFELIDAARYIFVAGGIGITPILAQIREASRRRRPWRLVYGGRTRTSMAFVEQLMAVEGGAVTLLPQDEYGLIDLPRELSPEAGAAVYCCGPEPLLAAVEAHCAECWPADALHVERFQAPKEHEARDGSSFEVVFERSGQTLTVPADRSILDVALEAGIPALWSCGEGLCGTCNCNVLDGEPDHRDYLLSDEERAAGGQMMICVSRARSSRIVLDL